MKLFNFVLPLALAAMPAVATASNHHDSKHGNVKSIFVDNKDESIFKSFSKSSVDLESHYLVGASNKFSSYSKSDDHKQSSVDSFQSKFESEGKLSKSDSWFGNHKFLTEYSYNHPSSGTGNSEYNHSASEGFGWDFKGSDWNHHGSENHTNWNNNNCAPVPEPTAYALMLAGLLMLGFIKRRKN
jgi:hypothetical protein